MGLGSLWLPIIVRTRKPRAEERRARHHRAVGPVRGWVVGSGGEACVLETAAGLRARSVPLDRVPSLVSLCLPVWKAGVPLLALGEGMGVNAPQDDTVTNAGMLLGTRKTVK